MDNNYRNIIEKNELNLKKITIKKNVRIVDTDNGSFVIKKKLNNNLDRVYKYLKSRAFDYFPNKIDETSDYEMYEYIEDSEEPLEQKAIDVMYLLSLLHSKTTFYKEIDFDYYKEIYENINTRLDYLYNYYNDVISLIEKEVYMSPSNYLIARNFNMIYQTINYCYTNLEKWYSKIKDKKKMRVVNINNNICLEHFLKSEKPYFISWNNSKIDMPIYDLLCFYKRHYLDLDFSEIFHLYESRYTLLEEERMLLFILIAIPDKIELNDTEYNLCIKISRFFDYLYKSQNLITTYEEVKH